VISSSTEWISTIIKTEPVKIALIIARPSSKFGNSTVLLYNSRIKVSLTLVRINHNCKLDASRLSLKGYQINEENVVLFPINKLSSVIDS